MSDTKFPAALVMAQDHAMARLYIRSRPENTLDETVLEKLMKQLQWKYCTGNTIEAELYGCIVIHELSPGILRAQPCWGELFFDKESKKKPVQFDSLECFVAFVLATWW